MEIILLYCILLERDLCILYIIATKTKTKIEFIVYVTLLDY